MKATFTLTRDDFLRFQKLLARRFRRRTSLFSGASLVMMAGWICIGMAVASYLQLLEHMPERAGSLYVFAAFVVLGNAALFALLFLQRVFWRKHMLQPDGNFLSPQTLRLTESSLHCETARLRSEVSWSAFVAVDQDAFSYYLFLDALQAIIVPKAAIAPHRAEFERLLAAYLPR